MANFDEPTNFPIPTGFDRADGETYLPGQDGFASGRAGTPTPSQHVAIYGGGSDKIEEYPDSPEIERAEQATFLHRLKCASWETAKNFISALGRGTFLTDSTGETWRVLSTKIQSQRGGTADISVTAESISFDSPPDEFRITPVELNIDIMKHPRYAWALLPYTSGSSTYTWIGDTRQVISYNDVKQTIVRMIQTYRDAPFLASGDNVNGYVQNSIIKTFQASSGTISYVTVTYPNSSFVKTIKEVTPKNNNNYWDGNARTRPPQNFRYYTANISVNLANAADPVVIALAAAQEIISKLWRGEDTPPVTGYEVEWSQYYFAPPQTNGNLSFNPGNYIENPIGIIPDYFLSPSQDGSDTIFDYFTRLNPQCFAVNGQPGGILSFSCLRKPDEIDYQRTWFRVTRKWLISMVGHWDKDLMTQKPRPLTAAEYNILET